MGPSGPQTAATKPFRGISERAGTDSETAMPLNMAAPAKGFIGPIREGILDYVRERKQAGRAAGARVVDSWYLIQTAGKQDAPHRES